jgi:hypothetical protein
MFAHCTIGSLAADDFRSAPRYLSGSRLAQPSLPRQPSDSRRSGRDEALAKLGLPRNRDKGQRGVPMRQRTED